MQSLASLDRRKIKAVFSDLDDTITLEGKIIPATTQALWDLHGAGIWTVIVSGRPAGWADCLMRLLPLDALIFENGAGLLLRETDSRGIEKITTHPFADPETIPESRKKLEKIFRRIKTEIPHLKLSTDQGYRLFDYAIDFNEENPKLAPSELDRVLAILDEDTEITAKLSSIHVNYWIGNHTKATACERLLASEGLRRGITQGQILYSGDSPNDEPLFEFFTNSVGVANVRPYLEKMRAHPKFITQKEAGNGFVEIVTHLLKP